MHRLEKHTDNTDIHIEFKTSDTIRIPLFEFFSILRQHNVVSQSNDIENQYNHFIEFQLCC